MTDNPRPTNIRDEIARVFDTGFNRVASQINRAYVRELQNGALATRSQQLQAEAQRLADLGQPMTADNPVLRAYLADLQELLDNQARLAGAVGSDMQAEAIAEAQRLNQVLALNGLNPQALAAIGISFNTPSAETLANLLQFTSGQAWRDRLRILPDEIFNVVNRQILGLIIQGKHPLFIARRLNEIISGGSGGSAYPLSQLNALMRTLQLTSYREASRAIAVANSDLISHKLRVAALDQRTCLACVALHGTEMKIDQRVDDHYNGRCIAIPVIKGRPRTIRSGIDWFNSLSSEQQMALAGIGNYNALQAGIVSLTDFVHTYEDDIFGRMVVEASLKGILGEQARQYYAR